MKCYDVRSSEDIIPEPELRCFTVERDHKLSSFDYVSMFINVDVKVTIDIVLQYYHCISDITDIPPDVFVRCLKFYTSDSTFFVFRGVIYKQIKSLAMGNRNAQVMAEIKANYALRMVLRMFNVSLISFFYKYVDDILSAIHEEANICW